MRVGAADAEGGDAGAARAVRSRATARLSVEQRDGAGGPVDVRRRARRRAGCAAASPWRIAMTILMTPGDAGGGLGVADVRLDRAEPQRAGRRGGPGRRWRAAPAPRWGRRAWCRCRGASTASTSAGLRPRVRRAPARMTRCWEGPLGAVRPLLAPSWLTALPRTTASTGWPLRRASESRSSSSTPDALGPAGAVGGRGEGLAAAVGATARAGG